MAQRLIGTALALMGLVLPAQADDYENMSLDDMMSLDIVESVTKLPEELFKAPVSVSILTRDEIRRSGASTIPEAMRLVPGLIVREQTPGNYDVQLRGLDNATVNQLAPFPSNSVTLVMIDYRAVYNYFSGGTFWETLPVSVDEIKQIEVITGPSSALYGPNAVAGVINIVTDKEPTDGFSTRGSVRAGTDHQFVNSAVATYSIPQKFRLTLSAQHQMRDRQMQELYLWNAGERAFPVDTMGYQSILKPDENLSYWDYYSNLKRSLKSTHFGARGQYDVNSDISLQFGASSQDSRSARVFVNNFTTPLNELESQTHSANLGFRWSDWNLNASLLHGEQSVTGMPDWDYDLQVLDVQSEYFLRWKSLLVRPSVSIRQAVYDGAFIGGEKEISSQAVGLLADYAVTDEWRTLASGRLDRYDHTDDLVYSYLASVTYSPVPTQLFRLSGYNAKQAPSMIQTHVDHRLSLDLGEVNYRGNPDLKPLEQGTVELGWKSKWLRIFEMDWNGFATRMTNFSDLVYDETIRENGVSKIVYTTNNYDLTADQLGVTGSLLVKPSEKLNVKLSGTVQQTDWTRPQSIAAIGTLDETVSSSPEWTALAALDYRPITWLGLWSDLNLLGPQEFVGLIGQTKVPMTTVWNVNTSLNTPWGLTCQIGIRNLLADDQVQYGFADRLGRTYQTSLLWQF